MFRRMLMAAACAGMTALGAMFGAQPAEAQGVNLTVFWNRGFYPGEDQALQRFVERWQQETGNRVEVSLFNVEDVPRRTIAALEAGQPPDVAYGWLFDFNFSPRWAFEGRLADLTDVVAPYRDDLLPVAIQAVTYLNGRTNQRSIYGAPFHMQTHHIHFWVDLLQQAGFQPNQVPTEWAAFWNFWCDQVQPAARRASNNRNLFGQGMAMSTNATDTYYNTQMFLNAYDVQILNEQGQLLLNQPAMRTRLIAAMTDYISLHRRNCNPPGSISWGDADNNVNFHNRQLVMTPNPSVSIPGRWLDEYNQARAATPPNPTAAEAARRNYFELIRTVTWPTREGRQPPNPVAVKQAVVFNNARNQEAGKAFLRSLMQPQNIQAYTEGALGRWFPVRRSLINVPFWTSQDDPHRRVVFEQYTTRPAQVFPIVFNHRYADAQNENVWGKAIGRVLVDNWTMERAVDELIARVQELLGRS
jgi:multiple sugar transport system substrate-binding protein